MGVSLFFHPSETRKHPGIHPGPGNNSKSLDAGRSAAAFLLGFVALSTQIYFMREFNARFYGNEITFGFLLASWLFWVGAGSLSAKKIRIPSLKTETVFAAAFILLPCILMLIRSFRFLAGTYPAETTGFLIQFLFGFLICFGTGFPLGVLFVFNVRDQSGNLEKVYILESLGSVSAGILLYFILIPFLSNWEGTAAILIFSTIAALFIFRSRLQPLVSLVTVLFLVFFILWDGPSQKQYWAPFHWLESKDTPYGKIQVVKTEDQLSIYTNTQIIHTFPDPAGAEETVHFALLQMPLAKKVLLIGGIAGGTINQLMKYPHVRIHDIEIDPKLVQIARRYLPDKNRQFLDSSRMTLSIQDGRAFLKKTEEKFDVIIVNLPEPRTAQINRFYTLEFFRTASRKLTDRGLISFKVPSAENYISRERRNFLASLYDTLYAVFPEVKIVPGTSNIFLASHSLLTLDIDTLSLRINRFHLDNVFVRPELLMDRLNPLRVDQTMQQIRSGEKIINHDFSPVSYFFNAVLWSSQFRKSGRKLMEYVAKIGRFGLLDIPLILFIMGLALALVKKSKTAFLMIPLGTAGLTAIAMELLLIIAYQASYGSLYRGIALLFTGFMGGLCSGAYHASRRKHISSKDSALILGGFVFFIALTAGLLGLPPPEWAFAALLFGFGYLGGFLFIVSNRLYLEIKDNYGLGYAIDLFGSFFGALLTSAFLIPLFGIFLILKYILLVNSFCLLFVILGKKQTNNS